jgi:hypothetical protein
MSETSDNWQTLEPVLDSRPAPEEPDVSYLVNLRRTAYREARETLISHANFVIVSAYETARSSSEVAVRPSSKKPMSVVLNQATKPVKPKNATGFVALKSRTTDREPFIVDMIVTRMDSPEYITKPTSTLASLYPYELRGHAFAGSKEVAFINFLRGMSRAIRTKTQPPELVPKRQLPAVIAAADNGREAPKPLMPGMIIDLNQPVLAAHFISLIPNPALKGEDDESETS